MVSVQDTTNRLFLLINVRRGLPRTRHVNDNYATPTPPPPPHEETTSTSRGTSHINCNLQAHWYTTPHHLIGVTLNCHRQRLTPVLDFLNNNPVIKAWQTFALKLLEGYITYLFHIRLVITDTSPDGLLLLQKLLLLQIIQSHSQLLHCHRSYKLFPAREEVIDESSRSCTFDTNLLHLPRQRRGTGLFVITGQPAVLIVVYLIFPIT